MVVLVLVRYGAGPGVLVLIVVLMLVLVVVISLARSDLTGAWCLSQFGGDWLDQLCGGAGLGALWCWSRC